MLDGEENLCGLGFEVEEDVEGGYGSWDVVIRPRDNKREKIFLPKTKVFQFDMIKVLQEEFGMEEKVRLSECGGTLKLINIGMRGSVR